MAEIPNFPQHFLDEHVHWHHAHASQAPNGNPGSSGFRAGSPGYGHEFLNFHRNFISNVCDELVNRRGSDPALFQPWADVPDELKNSSSWNPLKGDYDRVVNRPYTFRDLDELGLFLDSGPGMHRWVHNAASHVFKDPLFSDAEKTPSSSLFYAWHGLIRAWAAKAEQEMTWPRKADWEQLLTAAKLPSGDVIRASIEEDALPVDPHADAAVEFVLASELWWWKELNVPDGLGSSWNIHTGAPLFGGRRFRDSVALWAHQVNNGQSLTFKKANWAQGLDHKYKLSGLDRLPPRSRVTFEWLQD